MISDIINFWNDWGKTALGCILIAIFVIGYIRMRRIENEREYMAARNEQVSIIGDGVTSGIIRVFENQNFIQALNDGAVIKIDINVDGSQNIVIAGKNNQVSR